MICCFISNFADKHGPACPSLYVSGKVNNIPYKPNDQHLYHMTKIECKKNAKTRIDRAEKYNGAHQRYKKTNDQHSLSIRTHTHTYIHKQTKKLAETLKCKY